MKRTLSYTALVGGLLLSAFSVAFGQATGQDQPLTEKRAQTGMKFLSVSLDARASAMAEAQTAENQSYATAMFYNPATMGWLKSNADVVIGRTSWIVDINYNYGALALRPAEGKYGVFGLSFVTVDYGNIEETVRADNDAGYEEVGTFSPSAVAVGLGYAYGVSDRFSFGANLKYVREELGNAAVRREAGTLERKDYSANAVAVDFGILYRTGFKSLNFGMTARNFAKDLIYSEERFELPLTFRIGVSMNMVDFTNLNKDTHALMVSLDTERPRDFDERVKIGAEYILSNLISVRGGYSFPTDEQGLSLGGGLQTKMGKGGLKLDYSYTDFGVFDNVNRFTFSFSF